MPTETALRVHLPDRPGALAKVARQIADAGVNIRGIAGLTAGGEGTLEMMVDDLDRATQALRQGGTNFEQVRVVTGSIPERVQDTPGTLAQMAEALADAGINIQSLYTMVGPGGQEQAVLGSSDPDKAEKILGSWGNR